MTSKHPIPSAALDDRLGFTGTAGSGKTYNAGAAVERVLVRKGRVVIPDPLGVWWGLRVLADGKTPSPHNVVIFGGPHGDLPITEQAGALIGETVAGMAESCVLDLSQLGTKAAERRFMLAFLTAFYKHANGEPVHVVFDEADMWAPQRLLDRDGDAARLLGMMETIVRRGRVKGFIPWLITQRPAVLSKDVCRRFLNAPPRNTSRKRQSWPQGNRARRRAMGISPLRPRRARRQLRRARHHRLRRAVMDQFPARNRRSSIRWRLGSNSGTKSHRMLKSRGLRDTARIHRPTRTRGAH